MRITVKNVTTTNTTASCRNRAPRSFMNSPQDPLEGFGEAGGVDRPHQHYDGSVLVPEAEQGMACGQAEGGLATLVVDGHGDLLGYVLTGEGGAEDAVEFG